MDIEDLRTFVEVADSGGLSPAARRLGISKSMVSRRLRDVHVLRPSSPHPPRKVRILSEFLIASFERLRGESGAENRSSNLDLSPTSLNRWSGAKLRLTMNNSVSDDAVRELRQSIYSAM